MSMNECELAFARAMLADPRDAARRLVYADWLEEMGQVERAALVRAAEGWQGVPSVSVRGMLWLRAPASATRFAVVALHDRTGWNGSIAIINIFDGISRRALESRYVQPDGTAMRGAENWAWLLALAMSRGLAIPGLAGNRGNPPDGY